MLAMAFVSCKKERTCTCTRTRTTPIATTIYPETTTYEKMTKREAKRICQNTTESTYYVSTDVSGGAGVGIIDYSDTYDCKLK
jgi:(2Fe-2S) ferredoxin